MKSVALLLALLLSACATTAPVVAKFPDAPGELAQQSCPPLEKLKDTAKLSDVARTVATNYTTYQECSIKLDSWIEWYKKQKEIFESVGK